MKKTFTFSTFLMILLFLCSSLTAQVSLKFNEAKLITSKNTVPIGKVWKVESVMSSQAFDNYDASFIKINDSIAYVSSLYSGSKYWDNIKSLKVEAKNDDGSSCQYGYNRLRVEISGYDGDFPFQSRIFQQSTDISSTSYITIGTFTSQTGNLPLTISSIMAYAGYRYTPMSMRLTVTYMNGATQSLVYSTSGGNCGGDSSYGMLIGTYNSSVGNLPFQVPLRAKDTYFTPAKFPIWLPEGASIEPGKNIHTISVIEFDAVP